MEEVKVLYGQELGKMGHIDTGKLLKTAEIKTVFIPLGIRSSLLLEAYFEYLERRLKPQDVPFQRGSGKKDFKAWFRLCSNISKGKGSRISRGLPLGPSINGNQI